MKPGEGWIFWRRPGSRLGWAAVGCGLAFVALWFFNLAVVYPLGMSGLLTALNQTVLPAFSIFIALCGLVGGVCALAALARGDRSWAVWLILPPAAFMLLFLLGEFLLPH